MTARGRRRRNAKRAAAAQRGRLAARAPAERRVRARRGGPIGRDPRAKRREAAADLRKLCVSPHFREVDPRPQSRRPAASDVRYIRYMSTLVDRGRQL